jgi:hypothetical protein
MIDASAALSKRGYRTPLQGSRILTPVGSKSDTLRVTTVMP